MPEEEKGATGAGSQEVDPQAVIDRVATNGALKYNSNEGKTRPSVGRPRTSMLQRVEFPPPLTGGFSRGLAPASAIKDDEALTFWLEEYGVQGVRSWGEGNTKPVKKLRGEVEGNEACIELWETQTGEMVVVRSLHVLRGKVCSQESRERGMYVFNTWQQFGDGRKRKRNGLLSEKLSTAELPIEQNLMAVCERAVIEEEMQRVCEPNLTVRPGEYQRELEFRKEDGCPLHVTKTHFVDHTVEIEESRSFPGLLTMYHLYTVDIVCTGLPRGDFGTLEFEEKRDGDHKLKYIHSWVWLDWNTIRRYLFEGSECKETVGKGRFYSDQDLEEYLAGYGLETWRWGSGVSKNVQSLLEEIEAEEATLELWSRHDGISILVRVIQVIRGKVMTKESIENGEFLLNTWQQFADRRKRQRDMLLMRSVQSSDICRSGTGIGDMCLDNDTFRTISERAIKDIMGRLEDGRFELRDGPPPPYPDEGDPASGSSTINVKAVDFSDHTYDVEESPSYPGLLTVYHFYTVDITCENLPTTDFTTVRYEERPDNSGTMTWQLRNVYGWTWMSWSKLLSVLQRRIHSMERQDSYQKEVMTEISEHKRTLMQIQQSLQGGLGSLDNVFDLDDEAHRKSAIAEMQALFKDCITKLQTMQPDSELTRRTHRLSTKHEDLPPDLLDNLAQKRLVDDEYLKRRNSEDSKQARRRSSLGTRGLARIPENIAAMKGHDPTAATLDVPPNAAASEVESLKLRITELEAQIQAKQNTTCTELSILSQVSKNAEEAKEKAEEAKEEAEGELKKLRRFSALFMEEVESEKKQAEQKCVELKEATEKLEDKLHEEQSAARQIERKLKELEKQNTELEQRARQAELRARQADDRMAAMEAERAASAPAGFVNSLDRPESSEAGPSTCAVPDATSVTSSCMPSIPSSPDPKPPVGARPDAARNSEISYVNYLKRRFERERQYYLQKALGPGPLEPQCVEPAGGSSEPRWDSSDPQCVLRKSLDFSVAALVQEREAFFKGHGLDVRRPLSAKISLDNPITHPIRPTNRPLSARSGERQE